MLLWPDPQAVPFFQINLLFNAEFKFLSISLNSNLYPGGSILNDHFWLNLSRPSTTFRKYPVFAALSAQKIVHAAQKNVHKSPLIFLTFNNISMLRFGTLVAILS
jgi:hypothetical protein